MSLIDARTSRVLFTVLLFALGFGFLYIARHTLIAFLFAVFFAYLVDPAVSRTEKLVRGRGRAIGLIYLLLVVLLLPLLPEAFMTLFGAEAAGIANPVNPLLEPDQIAEILEAANTTILVALGPVPGTDIWKKVEQVRGKLKHLKAIVQVHGPSDWQP